MRLEGAPDDDQRRRLEDFLSELKLIARIHGIALEDVEESVRIVDITTGHTIGIGLSCFTAVGNPRNVITYTAVDSILDGAWPVDTDSGPVEQRLVRRRPE